MEVAVAVGREAAGGEEACKVAWGGARDYQYSSLEAIEFEHTLHSGCGGCCDCSQEALDESA